MGNPMRLLLNMTIMNKITVKNDYHEKDYC